MEMEIKIMEIKILIQTNAKWEWNEWKQFMICTFV